MSLGYQASCNYWLASCYFLTCEGLNTNHITPLLIIMVNPMQENHGPDFTLDKTLYIVSLLYKKTGRLKQAIRSRHSRTADTGTDPDTTE
ncbi:hypothetical protein MS5N3_05540 [Marinobacter salsuginis]|uniref:Uncharacterized protein n=1 Tax=Marinobacter salsuginis TaxID=418719 RepID=A0A5M3PJL9_9GAMM|nr:hypothetical protein MS5N3_05540 [Marinobacter salsuginis]